MYANGQTITLDYAVTNQTHFDMPFIWSIHPLIRIEKGMSITLPAGIDRVRLEGAINSQIGENGSQINWPIAKGHDLSKVPANDFGRAYKIFTPILDGDSQVETAIYTPSGEHALIFHFSPKEISHVGLWMNYGAWSGIGSPPYFNLGLEPCIGSKDALPDAKTINEFGLLPAGKSRTWSLGLEIK